MIDTGQSRTRAPTGELVLPISENGHGKLDERLDTLASSVEEIAVRVRAAELASGDEKTAKELRRAVEAVAKHDPKLESRLANRIDVLADRLGTLASAVSTTSAELARRDGQLAALQREVEQGSVRIEALRKDVAGAATLADVAKLRETVAERAPERPVRGESERLDRVEGKLGLLAERIDTLAPTVTTATAGLAARDGELANLRQKLEQVLAELRADPRVAALAGRIDALGAQLETSSEQQAVRDEAVAALRIRIDDAYEKAGAAISELQRSLAAVSSRLGAIEELPATVAQALEAAASASELEGLGAELRPRLEALESERSAIGADVDRVASALDSARAAVQKQLDELAGAVARVEQSAGSDETEQRMSELAPRIDALAADLAAIAETDAIRESSLERAAATRSREVEAQVCALAETVDAATDRLAAFEMASSERVDRVSSALDTSSSALKAQLDGFAAALERSEQTRIDRGVLDELAVRVDLLATELARTRAATDDHESAVPALRARIDDAYQKASTVISELQLSLAALVPRVGALEALPERLDNALQAHADELGTRMNETASEHADLLADLGARVALAIDRGSGEQGEIDRILDVWASDRSALESRLDEIAAAATRADSDEGLTRLRGLVEGLERRLAEGEREMAELRVGLDLDTRLNDIGERLDVLERGRGDAVIGSSAVHTAGDGRFRLELRALELRIEQMEKNASRHHEELGAHLERLAPRTERRPHGLEPEHSEPAQPESAPAGAQVVRFRGAEV